MLVKIAKDPDKGLDETHTGKLAKGEAKHQADD